MIRIFLAVVLALALPACGFQLRNAISLPAGLGPVSVKASDRYSPLAQALAQALERAGATPAPANAGDTAARLEILSERWADTPISVDQLGRAQEFTLRYAVVFVLRKPGAGEAGQDAGDLVPQQAIELSRDYVASPASAIGKASERELLVRELRREMTASILRRIDAVSRNARP